MMYSTFSGWLS